MKSIFPGRVELAIFVAMAAVCGALTAFVGQRDTMLFVMTGPVFLVAALLGFRRSLVVEPVEESSESEPSA